MSTGASVEVSSSRWRAALLVALPLLATLYFYAPILGNYFFGDDLLNLYHIVDWGFWRFVLTPYSGHVLVLRNAIYYACFELFGPRPWYFFALVLLTHLLNVYLLFRVVAAFTGSVRLACFAALLWGISPGNEGTIGWYSVYGQALVGTGALWILLTLAKIAAGETVSRRRLCALAGVVLAISTLFGTGTGVAMATPLAAALILPAAAPRRRVLGVLVAAGLAVPILYYALHFLAHRLAWGGQGTSLTQVLHYGSVIFDLSFGLMGRGVESLFLGRDSIPAREPPALVVLLAFAGLLALAAYFGDGARRRQLLAFLGLAGSGYFMITLGRGLMVAKGMRAELVLSAARYQYLGPIFFTLALCVALAVVARRWRLAPIAADALLALSLAIAIGARVATASAIDSHRFARRQTEDAVRRLHAALDSAPPGRDVYLRLPERPFFGVGPMLLKNPHLFPSFGAVFAVFFPDNTVDGRRVFFVTDDPRVLLSKSGGRRGESLFVSPKDVPAGQPLVDF